MYLPWIPQDIWNAVYTKNQIITTVTWSKNDPLVNLTQRAELRAKRVKQKSQGELFSGFKPSELAKLMSKLLWTDNSFVFSIFTPFELECLELLSCACPTIVSWECGGKLLVSIVPQGHN